MVFGSSGNGRYSGRLAHPHALSLIHISPAKAQEIISAGDVPLGTQGNLFGITGGEGTGKSNYVAAIVAGCICPVGADVDTLGIQITANGRHKAVLLYDTEQSEVQLFKNVSNLLARAKQPDKPDELKAFLSLIQSRCV